MLSFRYNQQSRCRRQRGRCCCVLSSGVAGECDSFCRVLAKLQNSAVRLFVCVEMSVAFKVYMNRRDGGGVGCVEGGGGGAY